MKQLILLLTLLIGMALAVKGQSTYLNPLPGNTHTYSATVTDAGNDNPVRWYVTTNSAGTTKAVHGTDFTFVTAGYVAGNQQLEGTAVYDVNITWGAAVADATNFWVFIEVDDDVTNCTNTMGLHIQIAADFNAVAYNVTGSATPGTVDPSAPATDVITADCPVIDNPVYNSATTSHTDIGDYEIVYRVNREFSLLAWQFEYQLSEQLSKAFTLEGVRIVNQSGTQIYSGTDLTRTQTVAADQNYVLVYATITNQQGTSLDLDLSLLTAGGNTKDANNNVDGNAADNVASFEVQAMPAITGFGGL